MDCAGCCGRGARQHPRVCPARVCKIDDEAKDNTIESHAAPNSPGSCLSARAGLPF